MIDSILIANMKVSCRVLLAEISNEYRSQIFDLETDIELGL